MVETDWFPQYETLWREAQALGATVVYDGGIPDGAGTFHPEPDESGEASPTIRIGRQYYDERSIDEPTRFRSPAGRAILPDPDLLRDLTTLAHEAGHFLSWRERTPRDRWEAYFVAAKLFDEAWAPHDDVETNHDEASRSRALACLTSDQRNLILAEERLAWAVGLELLEAVGFQNHSYYSERQRKALHFHGYRLGIEELWPEEKRSHIEVI